MFRGGKRLFKSSVLQYLRKLFFFWSDDHIGLMRLWDKADCMCYILSLFFKLKNKSPSKEVSPFLNWFLHPPDVAFLMSSLHFGAVCSCDANPQEQKISAFLWSYVKGAGMFAWWLDPRNFLGQPDWAFILGRPLSLDQSRGWWNPPGREGNPHISQPKAWLSRLADMWCGLPRSWAAAPSGVSSPWVHRHGTRSAFVHSCGGNSTEGMSLASLGFSFWKTEPIAPTWQVYFKRHMDFCEMICVKVTVQGLAPGCCSVTLNSPCLRLCVGKKHGAMVKGTAAGVRCLHLTPGSSVMLSEVCSMRPWFLNQR